jgi:hypothetical protein
MPDNVTTPTPTPGADQSKQMQEIMTRLLGRIAQPKMAGPQAPPQAQQSLQTPGPQHVVHGLFSLIQNAAAQNKKTQLDHATFRIKGISDAISDAYEMANGDPQKAQQIFMESPAVKSLMSKEGQKDMKQMEKLLQYDFINPEKKKTVWHEALEKVVKLSGAEKVMKGLRTIMGQHKDKMAEQVKQQGEAQHKQQEASTLAQTMFKGARPDPAQRAEIDKLLPSMVSASGADIRQQERQIFQDEQRRQREKFAASIDSIKDPIVKQVAKGIQASQDGDEEASKKYFDLASKGAAAKKVPGPMNLNKAIDDVVNATDPEAKKRAQGFLDKYVQIQTGLVTNRGLAFGMGRIMNYYNAETGETAPMNGFQVQAAIKNGESWLMTAPLSQDKILSMQQIVRSMNMPAPQTGKSLRQELMSDMKAFDNASDRAIISRVLRENPAAYSQTESTLGVWLDQNLTDQLSSGGKKLVQDIKLYAEVFNRARTVTGQSTSEMNTMLLLGLLPNERTPNSEYGKQQLEKSFNYIDGMVEAPILGGGKFGGGKAAPRSDAAKPAAKKANPLNLPGL